MRQQTEIPDHGNPLLKGTSTRSVADRLGIWVLQKVQEGTGLVRDFLNPPLLPSGARSK